MLERMICLTVSQRGSLELHDEVGAANMGRRTNCSRLEFQMANWWQKRYSPRHSTTFVPIALRSIRVSSAKVMFDLV